MIEIFSPAKINLTLDVFTKKSNAGFHELETIYHKLNWGDTITLEAADTFEIVGDFDCTTDQNLIYKAWQLINQDRSETGLEKASAVKVTVHKIIPSGAGLGGGSSNAAHFVLGYFKLFSLGEIPSNLIKALSDLGKDIPFFLQADVCALGTHFGEVISPLPFNFSGEEIYLYFPNYKSNTAEAYAQLKNFDTGYTTTFLKQPDLKNCGNCFKPIYEQNIYSKLFLSGSGSTFYEFRKSDNLGYKVVKTKLL